MKPGGAFALNPHATSYVPLSKRLDHADMEYKQIRDDEYFDMDQMEIEMDIEYLLATFSGLSQESITDVYLANGGDLEATIEMLNQLEIYSTEALENLPETLDICESGPSGQKKVANEVAASSSVIPNAPVSA